MDDRRGFPYLPGHSDNVMAHRDACEVKPICTGCRDPMDFVTAVLDRNRDCIVGLFECLKCRITSLIPEQKQRQRKARLIRHTSRTNPGAKKSWPSGITWHG